MEKQINLLNLEGNVVKTITLPTQFLIDEPNKQTIFDCIIAENAAERQGTHSTLTKGEVRGGGKKPWRQKHTGRARTGSTRNPQWVGGGIVFGPKPNRNYTKKVNSKVFQIALRSALTLKADQQKLFAIDDSNKMEKPSTKTVAQLIKNANLGKEKVLFVARELTNFAKSANNLEKVWTKRWGTVSVRDLVDASVVIFEEELLKREGMNL